MALLTLEGETLGQKRRHYNSLFKAAVTDQSAELTILNYDDPDLDNLLRIDIASSRRNVDYLLTVLQCEDMLYVSRAIKQSMWLITDDQYAHVINPKYLHEELFPKMSTKARTKLMHAIRINLRNESRVEAFFEYYRDDDFKSAQKWLPHCSTAFIKKVIQDNSNDIVVNTYKRLIDKSIDILKLLIKDKEWYYICDQIKVSKGLLKKYTDEYLNIIEAQNEYNLPNFGIRTTRLIMQTCPERIIKNFEKLSSHIHVPTFAKYLKREEIKPFLLKQAENKKMQYWLKDENLKHFLKYLPFTERFEFVKNLFIDKVSPNPDVADAEESDLGAWAVPKVAFCSAVRCSESTNKNCYSWYRFAPFDIAFSELKKMIRAESSPSERTAMLFILIKCAGRNLQQVHTLLQYYREKQINEPFKFKIQFVNRLLSSTDTHKFDENTWSILNDIFSSMEVYIESENSVPFCVNAIIVYKLIKKQDIPEIIQNKLTSFDTFKNYRKKLEQKEQDILFTYLYNIETNKLQKQSLNTEAEMAVAFDKLSNILTLIKEWEKKISDFPIVLEKIRYFIKLKKENSWGNNFSHLYNMEKKWRRDLFEESLALEPSDKVCINILKHDPSLLLRWDTEVALMRANDAISLNKTTSTLRIYWTQTLAQEWTNAYLEGLEKPTGHKATIEGICTLLPRKQFLVLLHKYAPTESKIDWSNTDVLMLSLQKNIAKRMKLVRPSLPLDAVLSYAKDDYLQYALPSLNAITYNMSASLVSSNILILFESPVSLKKHGLRLAFAKLKFSEIKDLVTALWKNTNNSSIRSILFKQTYDLLKKEKKESSIKELWELLNMFIENLTQAENKIIYVTLGKASDVPIIVRPEFFVKGYAFLKSLPAKANCDSIIAELDHQVAEILNLLDSSFVENVLLKSGDEYLKLILENKNRGNLDIKVPLLTSYILTCKDMNTQLKRYEKYIVPLLNTCFASWKRNVKANCIMLLNAMLENARNNTMKGQASNINIFKDINVRLQKSLCFEENYRLITHWNVAVLYVEILDNHLKESAKHDLASNDEKKVDVQENMTEKWDKICNELAPEFGKACLSYLKQNFSSPVRNIISPLFIKALTEIYDTFNFALKERLQTYKHMLDSEFVISYVLALEGTMHYSGCYHSTDKEALKIKREIYSIIRLHSSPEVKMLYHDVLYHDQDEEDDQNETEQIERAVPY